MTHATPFLLLTLLFTLLAPTLAQNTTTTTATPTLTRIVDLFFLNERDSQGLPYTLFHRDSASVIAVDTVNNLTIYAVTTTRVDRRPATRTDNTTATTTTRPHPWRTPFHTTATTNPPTTITQGPSTFLYTGTRYGPDHTIINHCALTNTTSASCNLTHVGSAWYTRDAAWNGTFSTYQYNWTSGDRFGFAPVTVTAGVELLTSSTAGSAGGVSTSGGGGMAGRLKRGWVVVLGVVVLMGVV